MKIYNFSKKLSIEQIRNRHQKTKILQVAGILAAILILSCVFALLPQSVRAVTVTATIPVGSEPIGVAVSPNGAYVYVTNRGDNSVSVISTASNTVTATVTVGTYPWSVAVTPNGAYGYVTNLGGNSVSVIDTTPSFAVSVTQGTHVLLVQEQPLSIMAAVKTSLSLQQQVTT